MAEDHCAVVCVLHDLNLAAQYATKLAVMRGGRLYRIGRPSRVLSPALLADVFNVDALVVPHPELSCPMVVARGPLERKTEQLSLQTLAPKTSNDSLQGGFL